MGNTIYRWLFVAFLLCGSALAEEVKILDVRNTLAGGGTYHHVRFSGRFDGPRTVQLYVSPAGIEHFFSAGDVDVSPADNGHTLRNRWWSPVESKRWSVILVVYDERWGTRMTDGPITTRGK